MFSQACVMNSVHREGAGCIPACTGQRGCVSPCADTPRQTSSWTNTPLSRHLLGRPPPPGRHPLADTPLGRHLPADTPWADTRPPPRQPLRRTIRILLEYILVLFLSFLLCMAMPADSYHWPLSYNWSFHGFFSEKG